MELKIKSIFEQKNKLAFVVEIEVFEFDIKQRRNKQKLLLKIGGSELVKITSTIPIIAILDKDKNKIVISSDSEEITKKAIEITEKKFRGGSLIKPIKKKVGKKIEITFECQKINR
jgi:CMP-N-acetylneuraminic acid synthetase